MRRRFAGALLLAALTLSSCAATLRVQASAPLFENDAASCTLAPVLLSPAVGVRFVVWFAWSGPSPGSKSFANLAPGALASLSEPVKAGSYAVRAWAVDEAGNVGCDTTITVVLRAPPARVGGLRLTP